MSLLMLKWIKAGKIENITSSDHQFVEWVTSPVSLMHVGDLQDGFLGDEDARRWVDSWEEDGEDLQADGHQQGR